MFESDKFNIYVLDKAVQPSVPSRSLVHEQYCLWKSPSHYISNLSLFVQNFYYSVHCRVFMLINDMSEPPYAGHLLHSVLLYNYASYRYILLPEHMSVRHTDIKVFHLNLQPCPLYNPHQWKLIFNLGKKSECKVSVPSQSDSLAV